MELSQHIGGSRVICSYLAIAHNHICQVISDYLADMFGQAVNIIKGFLIYKYLYMLEQALLNITESHSWALFKLW